MSTVYKEALMRMGAATLFESGQDVMAVAPRIAPLYRPITLCGTVFTVLAAPGDNLALHRALAAARRGDVIVASTGEDVEHAFWGELMTESALYRGIAGLVTDGAVRDTRVLRERGFPVFSAGTAIRGPAKARPGVLGRTVRMGGVTVSPGDWIVGDDDGVVVVPQGNVEAVLEAAKARADRERAIIERIRKGKLTLDLLGLRDRVPESGG